MQAISLTIETRGIRRWLAFFAFVLGLLAFSSRAPAASKPGEPVDWSLDVAHSRVEFKVRHMGLSWVSGHFKEIKAMIKADPSSGKVTAVEASAAAGSIDTGISARDDHLKGPDFFDAAKYPEIKAKLKKIEWKGSKFKAQVELTMKDKTKTLPVEGVYLGVRKVNFGKGDELHAGYSMSGTINRQDFGLSFSQLVEGVSMVGDQVKLELEIEITRPAG